MHELPRTRPTSELVGLLSSPDPGLRDDVAYVELAGRISEGGADGTLRDLGEQLLGLLGRPEVYARSFAALVLADVVARDGEVHEVASATLRRWRVDFSRWYLGEEDLRGWDAELGWLHAVAHGADVIAAFARSPRTHRDELLALLETACDRLLRSDAALFADQEDDRLAYAVALVLARPELDHGDLVGWLVPLRAALERDEPGPVPRWVTNVLHTLRALYVLVERGVLAPPDGAERLLVPGADAVAGEIANLLRAAFPFVG